MSVRLALLRSGEYVISDISEMIKDERMIGYILTKPCVVEVKDAQPVSRSILNKSKASKKTLSINLFPWIPFSSDEDVLVPMDWIVTLVTPFEDLMEIYQTDVLNYGQETDKDSSTDEQSDSDQSD
jgi:hypothetical protein